MELVEADVTEDPGYVSCMFCTARCFKLHGGHGVKGGSKGCGAAPSSSHSPAQEAAPYAGVKGIGTSRKHRAPFFVKTVKVTTVRRKNCELHLPAFFFKDYGDRFQKFVLLQGPGGQVWPVNLCVSCGSTTGRPTVRFSRGWKEFAADHHLELGDKLIFTLVSFSRFSVQVFDPLGKKKPTSTKAVSGWSFRREELVDGETPKQKKSIFVNWQNKVVRQATLGSGVERSKKAKAVENGQTNMPMLYRHLKRENKKLENRNAVVAKFRARKPDKSLPLSLLGRKWSKQSGSTSSSDSEEEFVDFNGGNGGETDLLLEWESLENASPLQTWPLALSSSDSSKALVTTQQPNSAGTSKNKPMNLSIASVPDPSPASNPHVLENREQGKCRSTNVSDQHEEEDPLQAYWKHNERSSYSAAWSTDDIHRSAKPMPNTHVLNVRPISALESPQEVDAVYTPSSPTLSLSHYLEASSPEAVQSHHGQESRLLASPSQQRFKFPDQWAAVRKHMEKRGGGCADSPVLGSEDLPPRSCHTQSTTQVRGIANSPRQSSFRMEESTLWSRSLPDDDRAHLAKSANGFNPIRVLENNASRETVVCDSQLGIHNPSRTPKIFSNSMPTRSDLSLAYFLNQPRPTARRPNHEEEGDNADQQSLGEKLTNAKGTSGSEIDRVPACGGSSLQKRQKSAVVTDEIPGGAVSGRTFLDVGTSDKVQGSVGELARGVKTAGLTSARQMQCPAELLAIKTARCYVDEDFNIRTSPGSREIPATSPANTGPLVVSKRLERDASFSDEQYQLHQKELELTCKRSGRDDHKSTTKRIRSEEEDGDSNIRTTSQEIREIQAASPASSGPLVVSNPLERNVSFPDEQDQLHQKELTLTCKRSGNQSEKDDPKSPTKRFRGETTAAEVLTERNPNHQKIPTPSLCTISRPTNDNKPAPACRKAVGITEYLEQKRVARKTRPRLKTRAGLGAGAGAGAVAVAAPQKASSIAEDIKPLVNASSNPLLGAASKTMRGQMGVSNPRASASREELKMRKLGGTFNLTERTPITHMRKSSGNRCDLVELEGIASEEDEPAGGDLFEVEESWDTWMEIIRQRDHATSSHHLRTPLRLKPR